MKTHDKQLHDKQLEELGKFLFYAHIYNASDEIKKDIRNRILKRLEVIENESNS